MKMELNQEDNVIEVINKIKDVSDLNIDLFIPEGSVLFENFLNLKLIQHEADKMEKSINFSTDDEHGEVLLGALSGKEMEYIPEEFENNEEYITKPQKKSISIPRIQIPSIGGDKRWLLALIPLVLIGSFIYYGSTAPKATVKITVGSNPFIKSISVKIKADSQTNVKEMILRGSTLSAEVEDSLEKETTGSKTVGEKATGEIKIYNKTDVEIELDKGNKITYKEGSKSLVYVLKESVTIPPREEDLETMTSKWGEAEAKVEASDIGSDYNIDDNEGLSVLGKNKSEAEAKTKGKISGGSSEEIKVVVESDRTDVSSELKTALLKKAEEGLKNKLASNQKLVEGSTKVTITSETFSAQVGDEKNKISVTQKATAEALIYTEGDLNTFISEYFKSVIPEGHYMPENERKTEINVLGNSVNSIVNSGEADIQITLRSIVIPDIKEDSVRDSLSGKTEDEARETIESLKNIEYYEMSISPRVPFFSKVPKDTNRINVELIKENKGETL
jgi:hypothetical protein